MSTYENTRVTLIEQTGPIVKHVKINVWTQAGYMAPVRYTLEDGRTVETTERFRLKRDLSAFLDRLPAAPVRKLEACFDESGDFCGTRETFGFGQ